MGRAPFFIPLIGLIFGILLSEYLPDLSLWYPLGSFFLSIVLYYFRPGAVALTVMFTAVGWGMAEAHRPIPLPVVGEGYFAAEVLNSWETDGNAMMGIVEVDSVNGREYAPFNITVQMIGHRNVIAPGERIAFRSKVEPLRVDSGPEDIVFEHSLNRRFGVVGFSMVLPDSLVYCRPAASLSAPMYALNRDLKTRLSRSELDDNAFSLLAAMLLGDKTELTPIPQTYTFFNVLLGICARVSTKHNPNIKIY